MLRKLPYGANYLSWAEVPELREAFEDKALFRYITSGESVSSRFERAVEERLGAGHALATHNGTQALRLALVGTRPAAGTPVHIPAVTFVAVAGSVLSCGLIPVPVDVDERFGLDASLLPPDAERVVVAHMEGMVGPLPEGVPYVIEDTAQAMGGRHRDGRHAGTVGWAGTFSFHHAKVLTSGEGGLLTARDQEDWVRLRSYSDHGSDRAHGQYPAWREGSFYGENLCSNEAVASVQLQQFRHLDEILASLERHYALAVEQLPGRPDMRVVPRTEGDVKVSVRVQFDSGELRDRALAALTDRGLPGWTLDRYFLPEHPVLKGRASIYSDGFPWNLDDGSERYRPLSRDGFAGTRDLLSRTLCIPLAPELDKAEQDTYAKELASVLTLL
ncbi:DegT/DnrJ/EryC1/StrS family aminotransferase [Streptomyces sp. NBC_01433]|uniref:DegT/DnrJ/EryC1/StrS family aminotransferase n=1 Tax=Streptomyces sp. NBC_01433 TaxID=2903864 RepID=UPI0022578F25|nr:DegT/DnrJ/EryC1/StrS family aminotransferase [Streptomyces sp. NBC_01433]MCX4680633.1 DegT/DnrJ/EryC1/StrS family aminotransferase [Streptomyces sp. NBC_01433]